MTNSAAGIRAMLPGQTGRASGSGTVIAVDGPAGSGKSSAARGVARALGLSYLDTGAMYRALTWWLLEHGVDAADEAAVAECAARLVIEVGTDPEAPAIRIGGIDAAREIRTRSVSNAVSAVAAIPQVRRHLIARQRDIIGRALAAGGGIVAEGRDIGSVVAPDAPVKVFLTASEAVRAMRRSADLTADPAASPALTRREQAQRDRRDAPQMARAPDAVEIDATSLGLEQVIAAIVGLVRERQAGRPWTS